MFLPWVAKCNLLEAKPESDVLGNFPIGSQRLIGRTLVEDILRSLPGASLNQASSGTSADLRRSVLASPVPADLEDQDLLLPTVAHVHWALKGIAPMFTMTMEDADSIADAISIYARWMGLTDSSSLEELKKTAEKERSARLLAEKQYAECLLRLEILKQDHDLLKAKHQELLLKRQNVSVGELSDTKAISQHLNRRHGKDHEGLPLPALPSSDNKEKTPVAREASHQGPALHFEEQLVLPTVESRAFSFARRSEMLLTTTRLSPEGSGPGGRNYGLSKVCIENVKHAVHIPVHSSPIRDIKVHEDHRGLLIATTAFDSKLSVVAGDSGNSVALLQLSAPGWSCEWHPDGNQIYCGLGNGTVQVFDIRMARSPSLELSTGCPQPVHSLCVSSSCHENLRQSALIAGTMGSLFAWPCEGGLVAPQATRRLLSSTGCRSLVKEESSSKSDPTLCLSWVRGKTPSAVNSNKLLPCFQAFHLRSVIPQTLESEFRGPQLSLQPYFELPSFAPPPSLSRCALFRVEGCDSGTPSQLCVAAAATQSLSILKLHESKGVASSTLIQQLPSPEGIVMDIHFASNRRLLGAQAMRCIKLYRCVQA